MLDAPALPFDVAIAHMNLRRLREARELLVRRLGGDNSGRSLIQVAQAHGEPPLVERMKLHEASPGLVEHDIVAKMADALDDAFGVVDRPVIGALFDHRGAEGTLTLPRLLVLHQRVVANALADRRLVEILRAYGADEPVSVAVGRKINRNAAAHQQRALVRRLVVVAVEQHEVVLGDQIGADDLVRRRSSVEHEIGFLGAEDRRRLFLRLKRRPLVGQEIA